MPSIQNPVPMTQPTGLSQKEFNRRAHEYLAQLRAARAMRRFAIAEFARLAPLPPAAKLS